MAGNNDEVIGRTDGESVDNEGQNNPTPDSIVTETGDSTDTNNSQQEANTRFLTNILYENNGSVYGLEILLFDIDNNPIESVIVTDGSSFNSWTDLAKQIKDVCPPYTEGDSTLLDEIQSEREKVGKVQSDGYTYTYEDFTNYLKSLEEEDKWSSLKKLGSLENVLKNEPQEITNIYGDKVTEYPVEINATKFMDMTSDMFSKQGHSHTSYADKFHASSTNEYGLGSDTVYGHVKVLDNLNAEEFNSAEALSAHQGKLLNEKIEEVTNVNPWSPVIRVDENLWYKVNEKSRLIACKYRRNDYTGLASSTGQHDLKVRIDKAYAPSGRVTAPQYRGDVVVYFNADGSIYVYNLTKIKKINLQAYVLWHY